MIKIIKQVKMLIDIGANLTDGMYKGLYHGTQRHEPDLTDVLGRAWQAGIKNIIVTGGSLTESKEALELVQQDARLTCTIGCHPTRCGEFEQSGDADKYLNDLENLIKEAGTKVSAFGEFGLDYDRLQFCDKETQLKYLRRQLEVAIKCKLPLFLHCRAAATDLVTVLQEQESPLQGVVHSFDGSLQEAEAFITLGLYIGINGCSLKTQENLDVVKQLPLERILLETDAPWCEVRPSHSGFSFIKSPLQASCKKEKWKPDCLVKSRNEPCTLVQILEIVSRCRGQSEEEVTSQVYKNTTTLFPNLLSSN